MGLRGPRTQIRIVLLNAGLWLFWVLHFMNHDLGSLNGLALVLLVDSSYRTLILLQLAHALVPISKFIHKLKSAVI